MTSKNDKPLSETELAKRWGVTTRTLQYWRKDGKGPAFTVLGKTTIRYRMEDIKAYEAARLNTKKEPE